MSGAAGRSMPLASPFRRNVAATSIGLAIAQGGQLALLLPMARIFEPEALGLYGAFAAVVIVLAACSTARYEMAIPTSRSLRERRSIVMLCATLSAAVGVLAAASSPWWAPASLGSWSGTPWLVLAWLPTLAIDDVARIALQREGSFRLPAIALVVRSIGGLGAALALGLLVEASPRSLLLGAAAGTVASVVIQGVAYGRRVGIRPIAWRELRMVARRHRRCATMLLPGHVALVAATQGPVYVIEAIAGPAAAGSFLMAQRILFQPVQFVSGALAQAFFPEAATRYRATGECWSLYRKALLLMAACAVPVALLATPIGPMAVEFLLGSKWAEAGVFAQILAIAAAIRLLDAPLSSIRLVAGRYGFDLVWKICLMLLVLLGTAIGAVAGAGVGAVIGLAGALAILHSASLAFAIRLARGDRIAR